MQTIVNYEGLFGETQLPITSDFIQVEPLEKRSRTFDWEISQHIHTDLCQFFLIWAGKGVLFSEHHKWTFESPCIITVPNNSLHGFSFVPEINGKVITLHSEYLYELLTDFPEVYRHINQLQMFRLDPTSQIWKTLSFISESLTEEMNDIGMKLSQRPLLQLFCTTLFKLRISENIHQIVLNNPSLKIFNAYQNLINKNIRSAKYVREYAAELNISTVHLNRICRQVVNKSALRIIHEKTIEEAKKYLLRTEYSISQIAYLLNFNDPAHFTKLFKKYVGVTPGEFRKE